MQQIQLNIPEPCHEDWQQMTPTEQGRFCNACAKQVVDFSLMTDTQVLNYFSNIKNEKVCGRAYPDQLDRMITMPKEPKKRLFWYWNYITMLFLFFSKTNAVKAQGGIKVDTVSGVNNSQQPFEGRVRLTVVNDSRIIKGTVKDENGNPIAGASVRIKGSVTGTVADAKGTYNLKTATNNDILQVSSVGFDFKEVNLKGLSNYDIILTSSITFLAGEVVVVGGITSSDDYYSAPTDPKHVVVLEVKDNATMQPVKASVTVERKGYYDTNTATTDKKGIYKIKKIREYETYTVKIKADGYLDQELQIKGNDIDQRKVTKNVFLENAPVLSDYKKMEEVVVKSLPTMGRLKKLTVDETTFLTGAVISGITIKRTITDSIISVYTKITGDLKIYPSPVQKGNPISVALKLKQPGVYKIQLINAAGLIVLQKQSIATAKQYIEQVQTGKEWSSGIYYIRIFDSNNNMLSTSNFLIQ